MGSISVPVAAGIAAGADASAATAAAAGTAASVAAATGGAAALSASAAAGVAAGGAAITGAIGTGASAAAGLGSALGAGSIFTLGNIATVGGLVSSGASAFEQHKAGVAQANDAAAKSRQAGLEAGQKQINIRQNMLKALASQNAAAGAGGIGTGGSFGANVNRQITQNQSDLLALSADTSSEQQQYGLQGSNAKTAGNVKAGASLLDAGLSAANGLN